MKPLFDRLSVRMSKATTCTYSTSFSLGIQLLHRDLRDDIYAVYGFVRIADEIVDSFKGYDQRSLLSGFSREVSEAIESRISTNPLLNAFQMAFHHHHMDVELVEAFLKSMAMDLEKVAYTDAQYREYIFGSAEAVGLMCLRIFTRGNVVMYENLEPYARRLGAAFQKINFLRDIANDYYVLGRSYFPGISLPFFNAQVKEQIEKEIEADLEVALEGIKLLPASSKGGVYLAYVYYRSLFKKLKKLPFRKVLGKRVRLNNGRKLGLMVNSLLEYKLKLI